MTSTPVTNAAAFIAPASNTSAQGNLQGKSETSGLKGLSFSDTMMQQTNLNSLSTAATRANDRQISNLQSKPSKAPERKPETDKPESKTETREPVKETDKGTEKLSEENTTEEVTTDEATEGTVEENDAEATQIPVDETEETKGEVLEIISTAVIADIAQVLDVTEADVAQAMEDLNLESADLFTQEGITKLAMVLTGNTEPSAMLTDEGLYAQVQTLIADATKITEQQAANTGLTQADILEYAASLREEGQNAFPAADTPEKIAAGSEPEITAGSEPEITVTVEKEIRPQTSVFDGRSQETRVKLEAGQAAQVQTVQTKGNTPEENAANSENGGMLFQQNQPGFIQQAETTAQTPAPTYVPSTEEIMNQVMDYMRISLTPDTNELSMQLNPESMGTIHVQIVEKNGTISAQFQTTNETVKEALETQMVILKQNFEEQGIKVDAIQVTVNDSDFERDLQQGFGQNNQQADQNGEAAPRRVRRIQIGEDGNFAEDMDEEDRIQAEMMAANGNSVDLQA